MSLRTRLQAEADDGPIKRLAKLVGKLLVELPVMVGLAYALARTVATVIPDFTYQGLSVMWAVMFVVVVPPLLSSAFCFLTDEQPF